MSERGLQTVPRTSCDVASNKSILQRLVLCSIGRLATYKYFNMDQAIRTALDYYREHLKSHCR